MTELGLKLDILIFNLALFLKNELPPKEVALHMKFSLQGSPPLAKSMSKRSRGMSRNFVPYLQQRLISLY